jgi:hypothetical protein
MECWKSGIVENGPKPNPLLNTTHCRLQTADCKLPTANCLLPTTGCLLPTANCRLQTAYRLLPPADCKLPTASRRLSAADCLLPTFCLPTTYCLLKNKNPEAFLRGATIIPYPYSHTGYSLPPCTIRRSNACWSLWLTFSK